MANSGFGYFAGSFADSFLRTKQMMDDKKLNEKIAKLQGQLLETQIKQAQQQQGAQANVQEMMTTGNTLTPGGRQIPKYVDDPNAAEGDIPELVQRGPMSLPEMLADPQGMQAMLQSGYVNVKDLIGSQGSQPATLQLLQAAGIDPQSEEGRQLITADIAGTGSSFEEVLASLACRLQRHVRKVFWSQDKPSVLQCPRKLPVAYSRHSAHQMVLTVPCRYWEE